MLLTSIPQLHTLDFAKDRHNRVTSQTLANDAGNNQKGVSTTICWSRDVALQAQLVPICRFLLHFLCSLSLYWRPSQHHSAHHQTVKISQTCRASARDQQRMKHPQSRLMMILDQHFHRQCLPERRENCRMRPYTWPPCQRAFAILNL